MSNVLANLYTHMFRTGYIPDRMKCGTIITLHKGGKKRTDDPNNYRAMPLTSVIFKLFETVILERSTHTILANLSHQQGGFQQNLGCIMTYFILRESIYFASDYSSQVYVCFLDCIQAFDRVWTQGMFYKLLDNNIDDTSFIAITEMYKNVTSSVKYKGFLYNE